MILIRKRLQAAIESQLSKTQYGFRPSRSTSHALYLIRRVQDYAEAKGTKLSMAMLDWEKAFDKILHDRLYTSMERLGVEEHVINVIKKCYRDPTFYVRDNYGQSETKKQTTGIRQGCPLSPYLFVLVMTCVDFDIQAKVSRRVTNNRIPNLDFDAVYYADDTILFSTDNAGLNELLKHTENI